MKAIKRKLPKCWSLTVQSGKEKMRGTPEKGVTFSITSAIFLLKVVPQVLLDSTTNDSHKASFFVHA